ncbi:MAG TPA: hypothetical protein VH309_09825 [Elusimicrobiota bacterium]|jgi:hypothetical protein|nr:hypothetical protein [Elusimicrobiota bacterium]
MKASRGAQALLIVLALAACAGPRSRVKKHRGEFDSYPPAVQRKILAGQVEVGFTDRQVALALGRPDRIYSRTTAAGRQEVWAYGVGPGPRVGLGFGFGGPMGPGFYGSGISVAPPVERGARLRVVFKNGVVVAVESREG